MRIFVFLALLFGCTLAHAQYRGMLHKPYADRTDDISLLYLSVLDTSRSAHSVADTLARMRSFAQEAGDQELLLEADLLEAYYDYKRGSRKIVLMDKVFESARKHGVGNIAYRAAYVIALCYWEKSEYEAAMRWYLRLDEMMHSVDVSDFPNKADYLMEIGTAYYYFSDYDQAIRYFQRVAELPVKPFYENSWLHALNTMGLSYQKLGQLASSDSCFRRIISVIGGRSEQWVGIASGNLGYNRYLLGDYEAAMPLLKKDIRIAEKFRDPGLAAGSSVPIADILIHQGDLQEAKVFLDKTREYIARSGQTDRLRFFYPVLSKWHIAMNQSASAARFLDSALLANKRYSEKFNAIQLLRANQSAQALQRESALQELRVQSEKEINRRNLTLAVLAIILLLIILFSYRQRQAGVLRLKERDLKLLEANLELQDVRRQLEAFAHSVSEHEQAIRAGRNHELIEQLNRQVVLTDDGWNKFSELFGKLYPGFRHQLKTRCPSITPAEIRCLAMEKLHYTNKEMAALQGISTNAVMVTKHRIRKKLGLDSQEELEEFVHSV